MASRASQEALFVECAARFLGVALGVGHEGTPLVGRAAYSTGRVGHANHAVSKPGNSPDLASRREAEDRRLLLLHRIETADPLNNSWISCAVPDHGDVGPPATPVMTFALGHRVDLLDHPPPRDVGDAQCSSTSRPFGPCHGVVA